jgi:hypothetical protein
MLNNVFFNHAVYETAWKKATEPERSQVAVCYGTCVFLCWITKAAHTHLEYIIVIAFIQ